MLAMYKLRDKPVEIILQSLHIQTRLAEVLHCDEATIIRYAKENVLDGELTKQVVGYILQQESGMISYAIYCRFN
jgi:hypothetical protein